MRSIAALLADETKPLLAKRPVRITFVITDLDVGGAERALVALATGLDRGRWSPSVVCLDGEGALAAILRTSGIPTTCLDVNRRRPVKATLDLAAEIRRLQPEIVQTFLFHANFATRLAARLASRPIVVSGLRVAERERLWHLRLDRMTQHLGAGAVCVSEGVKRHALAEGGIHPDRLVVIPNGVELGAFDKTNPISRTELGLPQGAVIALFVGRMDRQKGVDILLSALRGLVGTNVPWHVIMVGDGPERTQWEAEARRDRLLSERVHWLGRRPDVPALLKTANLLILPSRWEGMPNVVLEAMAAGRAVVGTKVEGTDELVLPGETGWLVPPGDAQALSAALDSAFGDREKLESMGEAARARVAEHFSQQRVIAEYERLWLRLLHLTFDGSDSSPPPSEARERQGS